MDLVRGKKHYNVPTAVVVKRLIRWLKQFENPCLLVTMVSGLMRRLFWPHDKVGAVGRVSGRDKTLWDTLPILRATLPKDVSKKLSDLGARYVPNWSRLVSIFFQNLKSNFLYENHFWRYRDKAHSALFDVWVTIKVVESTKLRLEESGFRSSRSLIPTNPSVEVVTNFLKQNAQGKYNHS